MGSPRTARGPRWRRPIGLLAVSAVLGTGLGLSATSAQAAPLAKASTGSTTVTTQNVQDLIAMLNQWGDKAADSASKNSVGKNDASLDPGSLASITDAIGARAAWSQKDASGRAVTGQGVTVAVLDSGVNNTVTGLNGTGKVVYGPDLSLEANAPTLRDKDTFGHGTFMAGIIAAKDTVATNSAGQPLPKSDGTQLGIAPDAKLLGIKLASTDGSTDVSQVIAAIDWVVAHKNDNGMNVRVINLSYGTDSTQSYQTDPLAAAAELAWKAGIVVVASGGNEGNDTTTLTDPAIDPYVIAVGASTANNQKSAWSAPSVATFSQGGNASRHVDLVAPGTSLVSLRDPNSYVDVNHPEGLVTGDTTGRLFRGSGTSQAAAVVSGSVALLLQKYPKLTPDQVKFALMSSADLMGGTSLTRGAGELDVTRAMYAASLMSLTPSFLYTQSAANATGTGTLEAARGGADLVDPDSGTALTGEVDVQGQAWNGAAWFKASQAGTAWNGGTWNGAVWTGSSWNTSAAWTNASWSGARWTGTAWSSVNWSGARWTGARWTGARWTDSTWQ